VNTPRLDLLRIQDPIARENFRALNDYLQNLTNLLGFRFFEIVIPAAAAHLKYPHGLGFQPKDVVQLSITGAGALTWNYDKFDSTNLDITTTGACTVRAYIGTHVEGVLV
jgi:hypothetical protein